MKSVPSLWGPLLVGAYLWGAVPAAYLMAKRALGVDIRHYGSGSVGATNLLRLTSRRVAGPVFVFDILKGMLVVWAAWQLGFGATEQMIVGLAAVCGHNWSVFMRFRGGRGVLTSVGAVFMVTLLNGIVSPGTLAVLGAALLSLVLITMYVVKKGPVGIFILFVCFPVLGLVFRVPLGLNLALLGMFLVLIVRRLTAPQPIEVAAMSRKQRLLNRLLFDRDIQEKEVWMALVAEREKRNRRDGVSK
jgi:glycerol-3-phosphate acyltransferase PlsY